MDRKTRAVFGLTGVALVWAVGCAASGAPEDSKGGVEGETTSIGDTGDDNEGLDPGQGQTTDISGPTGSGGTSAGETTGNLPGEEQLPEEVENEADYRAPVATGRYLWSANPESGRVALIDAKELSVRVLSAGLEPTYLAALRKSDDAASAVVVNTGSSDVTRFIVNDGEVHTESARVHAGANRVTTSEHWAVVWSAAEAGTNLDPTEGLQEITILSVGEDKMTAQRLAAGYRPSQVQFAADESHVNVVSAEGIARIELDDILASDAWIDLGLSSEVRDVALSEDGKYALVREVDADSIDIINLFDPDDIATLQFSGPITDVDLAPTGRAVVVVRETRQVATFLLSEVLTDETLVYEKTLPDQVIGSAVVTQDGEVALLYTNVVDNDTINVVNLVPGEDFLSYRSLRTQSPVHSVVAAPGGEHAVVLAGNGSGARANAFAVIALRDPRFPRVVGTEAQVEQVAIADDFAVVTASRPEVGLYEAHTVLLPALTVDTVKLASQPLSVGVLPEVALGYVAQKHSEGRVTFFDFKRDDIKTLTGFELSAEVVDE